MRPDVFATNRGQRLDDVDKELLPIVEKALTHWSAKSDWYESIVESASVLWLEMFEQSVPDAKPKERDDLLVAFQQDLRATLAKTQNPKEAASTQAEAITEWVSTSTSNHAELRAARVNGHPALRWITRRDNRVRSEHKVLDGTTVPAGQTFRVGDVHLAYPGEPVGDPKHWIRCRCILQRVGEGKSMAGNATAFTEEDVIVAAADPADEDMVDASDDEMVDAAGGPVPFHGVAAPTDVPSGDNRLLRKNGASFRTLPLPLSWQRQSADGHSQSTVVGRIDTMSLDDESGNVVYDGEFNTTPEAMEAIQGVAEGWLRGVSVDVDMAEIEMAQDGEEADEALTAFSSWRIAGVTMVAIPAFEQAFIALGPAADDPNPQVDDGAEAKMADTSAEGRRKSADKNHALPDGSFPIENVDDLRNAIQAIGRAKDPAKAKAHIKKRANDLGHPELIPDGWAGDTETFAPGTEDGPGWVTNRVPTARLRRYWVHGEGAAKIGWNTPHDFYRCREHLGKYVGPAYVNGTCANLHREATGSWPGREYGGAHSLVEEAALMASAIGVSTSSLLASAAPALERAREQGVGYGEIMAVPAHRTGGKTAAEVLLSGDRLQVRGSDAATHTAKVVEVKVLGDRAVLSLEGEAVRSGSVPLAVAVGVHRSGPDPALAARLDETVELQLTSGFRRSRGQNAPVVAFAHSPAEAASLEAITKGGLTAYGTGHIPESTPQMAPAVNLVAAGAPALPPVEWFDNPGLTAPTPLTITEEGRIFAHVASWDVCHIGFDKVCTTAPHSYSEYAYYRTGEIQTTGGPVAVGQITMGAGHANMQAGAQAAAAHYDNVAHAVADVAAGEDEFGIWVAGSMRPGVADEDVRALRAASLSGDWRRIRGNLEMVAALAVNVPGFPIPRNALAASGDQQLSLVAAGVVQEEMGEVREDFGGRVALEVERVLARREKLAEVKARAAAAMRTARIKRARRMGR